MSVSVCVSGEEAVRRQAVPPAAPQPSDCTVGALTSHPLGCMPSISQDSPHSNDLPPCPTSAIYFSNPHSLVFGVEDAAPISGSLLPL